MAEVSLDCIRITANSCNVDFKQARRLAEEVILGMIRSPRLISWKDHKREKTASVTHDRVNAVRVDINNDDYSFTFTENER